jgi:hypothetical protein
VAVVTKKRGLLVKAFEKEKSNASSPVFEPPTKTIQRFILNQKLHEKASPVGSMVLLK